MAIRPSTSKVRAKGVQRPIDLAKRKIKNKDGSFSTERTITVDAEGGRFINLATIVGGKQRTPEQAIGIAKKHGDNITGVFKSKKKALEDAKRRSDFRGRLERRRKR